MSRYLSRFLAVLLALGQVSSAAVVVVATPPAANQAPVWTGTPNPTFTEGSASSYNLLDDVSDADGDPLTFTNETGCTLPTGVTIDNTNKELDASSGTSAGTTTSCVFSADDGVNDPVNSSAFSIVINASGSLSDFWNSGDTINAASCSYANVSSAVASADDGDTVVIPAGECSWSSTLTVSDAIYLKGAGSTTSGTRLEGSAVPLIRVNGVSTVRGYQKVEGIRFFAHSASFAVGHYLSVNPEAGTVNIRVTDLYVTGQDGFAIDANGCGDGNDTGWLLDNVTYRNNFLVKAHGSNYEAWKLPLNLGSSAYCYMEDITSDNTTQYGPATGWLAVDLFFGARVVLRHSTISGGYFGTHDTARAGKWYASARAWEVYENEISNCCSETLFKALDITAGSGVAFNNTITGSVSNPVGLYDYKTYDDRGIGECDGTQQEDENTPGESGWVCQFQVGSAYEDVTGLPELDPTFNDPWHEGPWGDFAVSDPAYFWGNTYNASTTLPADTGGSRLEAGRDYINAERDGYTPYTYPHPLTGL